MTPGVLIPNGSERLLRCPRCESELILCIPGDAWCSCPGRITKAAARMELIRLSKIEKTRRREAKKKSRETEAA